MERKTEGQRDNGIEEERSKETVIQRNTKPQGEGGNEQRDKEIEKRKNRRTEDYKTGEQRLNKDIGTEGKKDGRTQRRKGRGRDIPRDRVIGKQRTRGTYKQMF